MCPILGSNRNDSIDLAALAQWMRTSGLEGKAIERCDRLVGGTQNLLLRIVFGGRAYVLRRPPPNSEMGARLIVERESRVLGALRTTCVPHPALIAVCLDSTVIGEVFFLMDWVEGFNVTQGLPIDLRGDAEAQHAMCRSMVDAALSLSRVDHVVAGLSTFGRLEGYLDRQVIRWLKQLHGYRRFEGWDGAVDLSGAADVAAWLDAQKPPAFTAGLCHGDYHLANVIFADSGRHLAAIVDWELASLGDPLLDFAWMLETWPLADGSDSGSGIAVSGGTAFAAPKELISLYAAGTSRDLTYLNWYRVLACFKLGILQEGSYARARAGLADPVVGLEQHKRAIAMINRAQAFVQG